MSITINEIERPRKAKFAFRCYLSNDIVDNCAFLAQQMHEHSGAFMLVTSANQGTGTIAVYTDDEKAAESFRSALAFSKEFHRPR